MKQTALGLASQRRKVEGSGVDNIENCRLKIWWQNAMGSFFCPQSEGFWKAAIHINQHLKVLWWEQPHLKFLKEGEIFAGHPTTIWDPLGVGDFCVLINYRVLTSFLSLKFPHLLNRNTNIHPNFVTRILKYERDDVCEITWQTLKSLCNEEKKGRGCSTSLRCQEVGSAH